MTLAASVQEWMIRITLLITILFLGLIIGRVMRKIISRMYTEAESRQIIKLGWGLLLTIIAEYSAYAIALILITNNLGITHYVFGTLGILLAVLLLINTILQLLFSIPNLWARIALRKELVVGTRLRRKGMSGTIIVKRLTHVTIKSKGELFQVPYYWLRSTRFQAMSPH
ncbi:hypothetical protein GF342_02135 [Candidatus Woesearchaeota archaeon]|nr:hypothetical protein [Candidatus Woesearchaeota archaeon]